MAKQTRTAAEHAADRARAHADQHPGDTFRAAAAATARAYADAAADHPAPNVRAAWTRAAQLAEDRARVGRDAYAGRARQ